MNTLQQKQLMVTSAVIQKWRYWLDLLCQERFPDQNGKHNGPSGQEPHPEHLLLLLWLNALRMGTAKYVVEDRLDDAFRNNSKRFPDQNGKHNGPSGQEPHPEHLLLLLWLNALRMGTAKYVVEDRLDDRVSQQLKEDGAFDSHKLEFGVQVPKNGFEVFISTNRLDTATTVDSFTVTNCTVSTMSPKSCGGSAATTSIDTIAALTVTMVNCRMHLNNRSSWNGVRLCRGRHGARQQPIGGTAKCFRGPCAAKADTIFSTGPTEPSAMHGSSTGMEAALCDNKENNNTPKVPTAWAW
eukprot:CAMPEP_0194554118 /NCGR_PEP_ID=MMETSP0253-20130528/97573_2 /TAXON_ID=2966 /ORGANISM="Noctiluca scintillans" /LENGTH=296 /DNA_ID=CAMNT_0039401601 /DNA_START=241 /DNA_END=1133 /DNA_ORIENTATION=-